MPKDQQYPYTIKDFTELGKRFNISQGLLNKTVKEFEGMEDKIINMIKKSLIPVMTAEEYLNSIIEKY